MVTARIVFSGSMWDKAVGRPEGDLAYSQELLKVAHSVCRFCFAGTQESLSSAGHHSQTLAGGEGAALGLGGG